MCNDCVVHGRVAKRKMEKLHLQRIDDFIVKEKTDQNIKTTTFPIYMCSELRKGQC